MDKNKQLSNSLSTPYKGTFLAGPAAVGRAVAVAADGAVWWRIARARPHVIALNCLVSSVMREK